MDTKGEGGGRNWETGIDTYTLLILYIIFILYIKLMTTCCIAWGTLLNALW